ncbi:uncharacterized protein LOC144710266 [Wolffia australiana]
MDDLSQVSPPLADANGSNGHPICPICYEDLRPVAEDLLSISVCGHVFHEQCLHQWQEYCPGGKKRLCPVCKQPYLLGDVTHLFFQSTGVSFSSQKVQSETEYNTLEGEIKKLKGKISALTSALDAQKKLVDKLSSEVSEWKNKAQMEEKLKTEHQKENDIISRLLERKEADLRKSSEDCVRLKQNISALAKELASLKLAMDVNLGEEEVTKLVAMGKGTTVDAIDVLQRSLLLRNKCYKELMIQCNSLGRAETIALKKLRRAEEKIKLLKVRLIDMEKAVDEKASEKLRVMKNLSKKSPKSAFCRSFDGARSSLGLHCDSIEVQPDDSAKLPSRLLVLPHKNDIFLKSNDIVQNQHHQIIETVTPSSTVYTRTDANNASDSSVIENVEVHVGTNQVPSIIFTEKVSLDQPQTSFESSRTCTKWSRNPKVNLSESCGQLIVHGADGRGGTVKVLRDHTKFPESRVRSLQPKHYKRQKTLAPGAQPTGGIEHYFGKSRM